MSLQLPKFLKKGVAVALLTMFVSQSAATALAATFEAAVPKVSEELLPKESGKGHKLPPIPRNKDGKITPEGIRDWVARATTLLIAWTILAMQAPGLFWRAIVDLSSRAAANAVLTCARELGNALEDLAEGISTPTAQSVMDTVFRVLNGRGIDRAISTSAANAVKEIWLSWTYRF